MIVVLFPGRMCSYRNPNAPGYRAATIVPPCATCVAFKAPIDLQPLGPVRGSPGVEDYILQPYFMRGGSIDLAPIVVIFRSLGRRSDRGSAGVATLHPCDCDNSIAVLLCVRKLGNACRAAPRRRCMPVRIERFTVPSPTGLSLE